MTVIFEMGPSTVLLEEWESFEEDNEEEEFALKELDDGEREELEEKHEFICYANLRFETRE